MRLVASGSNSGSQPPQQNPKHQRHRTHYAHSEQTESAFVRSVPKLNSRACAEASARDNAALAAYDIRMYREARGAFINMH